MTCIVVGLDGSTAGDKALEHASKLARLIGDCELALVYVIEWTPYSFHTPEELEERHQRREQEIGRAQDAILKPAAERTSAAGFKVRAIVRHGDAAALLDEIARETGAAQIVVGRTGSQGLRERLFGGVSGRLIGIATVPVTIVP
jgi:nucleotide-binding universal stress UspA family protein